MSNERLSKSTQRVSRYSRASYDELNRRQYDHDLSLSELTEHALEGEPVTEPAATASPKQPSFQDDEAEGFQQPPPPDADLWNDETVQPQQRNVHSADHASESVYQARGNGYRQAEMAEEMTGQEARAESVSMPDQIEKQPRGFRRKRNKREARPSGNAEAAEAKVKRREARREATRRGIVTIKSGARTIGDRLGAMLINSGLWLARNLRRREIRRRFSRFLVYGHTHLIDRKTERLFFVPSRMIERFDPAPDRGIHYDGPVPVKAFGWIMSFMPDDLREYSFIDVRAELGRTSLLAAGYNFRQIVSYEYEPQRFDDLQMNIAQYPRSRMVCRNIDARRGDTDGLVIPETPCIIYLSNAWRESVIDGITKYISDSYKKSPRRIYIVLGNTAADTALEQSSTFDLLEPPVVERMKLRLLSPVDFKVYRSIV